MEWMPTTATQKIMAMNSRLKAVFGGASAGKTFSIIPILIDRALKNNGEVITIVSDTARNLRDGAMRDFEMIMKSLNRWDRARWNKSESKYTFAGGSVIEFLGADDPDKFRGPRRDRLYINEANRLSFDVFNQLDARTRKEVFLDWNPSAPFWYDLELKDKIEHDWLRLTYLDNESLSKMELAEFERKKMLAEESEYWANWWQVYGLGHTGRIEGACIKDYKVVKEVPEGYRLIGIGLDFGDNDPNAAVALYRKDDSYVFDEILYKNKLSIAQISRALQPYDAIIYADYAWPQTISELKKKGHTVLKCKKGPDSIKHGINLINEKDVYVTESSENLLKEFQSYRYKADKDGNKIDGKYEGPDHATDACRYVLSRSLKKRQIRVI